MPVIHNNIRQYGERGDLGRGGERGREVQGYLLFYGKGSRREGCVGVCVKREVVFGALGKHNGEGHSTTRA